MPLSQCFWRVVVVSVALLRHGLDLGCFNDTNDDDRKPAAVMKIYRNIELEMHSNRDEFAAANIDEALLWRIKSIHNG